MKTFIFDFDGTIADSLHAAYEIFKQHAEEFKIQGKLDKYTKDDLRAMTSIEVIKNLKIRFWRLPSLIIKQRKYFHSIIPNINTYPDMCETLSKLKDSNIKLGILSSNSLENIKDFLSRNKLDYFDFVYSEKSLFSKNKALIKIIKKENLHSKKNIYYVGDETRDIVAANKIKINSIGVTWGFNCRNVLQKLNPDYLIDNPADLLEISNS